MIVLQRRHLRDGGDNPRPADEGLVRLERCWRTGQVFAQPVTQLVRHSPCRLERRQLLLVRPRPMQVLRASGSADDRQRNKR